MRQQVIKPYEKYLIIWMDILGFKYRVIKAGRNRKEIADIENALVLSEKIARKISTSGIKTRVFSDSIVMTRKQPDINEINMAAFFASIYQLILTQKGYFLRGAAIVGSHYSKGNIAFGPAIIEALKMEKFAVWPRVLIAPNLLSEIEPIARKSLREYAKRIGKSLSFVCDNIQELDKIKKNEFVEFMTRQDVDGLPYMDYLRTGFHILTAMRWVSEYLSSEVDPEMKDIIDMNVLLEHKKAIIKVAKSAHLQDEIRILTKYYSMANYHNEVVDMLQIMTHTEEMRIINLARGPLAHASISEDEKEDFLIRKLKELREQRTKFKKYKIGLTDVFPSLCMS